MKKSNVSICIPTLDRCEYLCMAICSIYSQVAAHPFIEVIISNNASKHDYQNFSNLLEAAPPSLQIKYIENDTRRSIDEHMHFVVNAAKGDFIYYLGDDDFFLPNQLHLMVKLALEESPDLAIFNGHLVDHLGNIVGNHFQLSACRYTSFKRAFLDLREHGMFGSVLVKRKFLSDKSIKLLYGSSHAYGSFWLELLREYHYNKEPSILIPSFPLVALRVARKSYSPLSVYFRDIPYEIATYNRYLPPGRATSLNYMFYKRYISRITSVGFLAGLVLSGNSLDDIQIINPQVYHMSKYSIWSVRVLDRLGAFNSQKPMYKLLRFLYRIIK
jgi:abequosyltransferase